MKGGKSGNILFKWYKAKQTSVHDNQLLAQISSSAILPYSFTPVAFATNKSLHLSVDEYNHYIKVGMSLCIISMTNVKSAFLSDQTVK